jgi:hypothetical protein
VSGVGSMRCSLCAATGTGIGALSVPLTVNPAGHMFSALISAGLWPSNAASRTLMMCVPGHNATVNDPLLSEPLVLQPQLDGCGVVPMCVPSK